MAELLLELLSEEIPARMQARAAEELRDLVAGKLEAEGIEIGEARAFATPRRLALTIDGLPERQADRTQERKGPRVGAPDGAIQGFLKSVGLTSLDQCEKRAIDKGEFWFAVSVKRGRPLAQVLQEVVPAACAEVPWPKSMRWGAHDMRWVRPLTSILCIFNGRAVPVVFGHMTAGNRTRGHRFLKPEEFAVRDFADYKEKLAGAKVILDAGDRARHIKAGAEKAAAGAKLKLVADDNLLDEVSGLVEWPVVLMGAIDAAFMGVPREVLVSSMRRQQRYFALTDAGGKLAPRFVVVANTTTRDRGKRVVAGNERVLRARLSDAKFFWDQDRKVSLESRVPALKGIVFHAALGTVADKVERMRKLAVEIAPRVEDADAALCRRAATLLKGDLTSGMVGEFPELQGIMGRYYALHDRERPEVADAIAEHYSPQGPGDKCPSAPTSVVASLVDKLDTLVGFFAINERPSGSKDPFALRRAALGVIRLILENQVRLPLAQAWRFAYDQYLAGWSAQRRLYVQIKDEFHPVPAGLLQNVRDDHTFYVLPAAHAGEEHPAAADTRRLPGQGELRAAMMEFFADRLKAHMREKGVRHDLVSAVFAQGRQGGDDDLVRLMARIEAVKAFLDSDDGANLLIAYRRAANIVRIEAKKDKVSYDISPDPARLEAAEEALLFERLNEVAGLADAALAHEEFQAACRALARLRGPVDDFFNKVTVNTDSAELRVNRLRLLARIRSELDKIADFSKIEG
jgi:glycyl-tRNA synthetase beta chain